MGEYVRGETYARRERPRFTFKPSTPGYTGGGYARIRSTEYREHTSGTGADDVFVAVHRLAAVAWHLPEGTLGEDVALSALSGVDVHHVQPDTGERGMPAANGEDWTKLVAHGRHSEITQAEMRAWGEDAKTAAEDCADEGAVCSRCGGKDDFGGTVAGREGLCFDCAAAVARETGETIEV